MGGFDDIIGQEHIKEHLRGAIVSKMASHAYIIQGEQGSGKMLIAETFARALQCENGMADPCNECHSCLQAISRNHPDIIILQQEKANVISVDEIRHQIVSDVEIKPYSSEYKIYIIPNAEKMNTAAQNALLKTLEEPPSYVVILLLCTNSEMLLETIRSRCVTLNITPLKDDQIKNYLMKKMQIPDYQASICVAFARGNLGKAKDLVNSESFNILRREATDLLKSIKREDIPTINKRIKKLGDDGVMMEDFLDYLLLWLRDVLIHKATGDTEQILFREEIRLIKEWATESTYEGLEKTLKNIALTRDRLKYNVNTEMTLELLMLGLKEN